jgi:hypothetical protein
MTLRSGDRSYHSSRALFQHLPNVNRALGLLSLPLDGTGSFG